MKTKNTIQLYSYLIRFGGSILHCTPYKFNQAEQSLDLTTGNTILWFFIHFLNLLSNIFFIVIYARDALLQEDLSIPILTRYLFPISLAGLSSAAQIELFRKYKDIAILMKAIFQLRDQLGVNLKEDDLINKAAMAWIAILMFIAGIMPPFFDFLIRIHVPPFHIFDTGDPFQILLISFFLTYITVVDIVIIEFFVFSSTLYVSGNPSWLNGIGWNANSDARTVQRGKILYRALQILNQYAINTSKTLITFALVTVSGILTFSFYCTVEYIGNGEFNPMYPVTGMIVAVSLKFVLNFATELTIASERYVKSFHGKSYEDKRFLRSCRPLYMWIGDILPITKDTFITISYDLVFQQTVDLLLA